MSELPIGWVLAPIAETLERQDGGRLLQQGWSPQCENHPRQDAQDWAALRTTSIQDGRYEPEHNKRLPDALSPRPAIEVHVGDVLLTCAGPRVRCGVACLVRETPARLMISGKMYRMRARSGVVEPALLEAFLRTPSTQLAIDGMKTGISESGMNLTHERFLRLEVPLAPVNEQRRIVEKLDAVFERSRAAKARLERLPALLEKLKRSILAAAFRGDLTKDWRAANPNIEPASGLLDRIRAERRRKWEDALRAKGKDPKRASYEEPAPVDAESLPDLPVGWAWASLADLSWDASYGTSNKCSYEGVGEAVLRIPNVAAGEIDVVDLKRANTSLGIRTDELLARGDFLVVRTNGSKDLIGRGAAVSDERGVGAFFASYLIRFRLLGSSQSEWCSRWWQSAYMRDWLESRASSSAGQNNISMTTLATAPVPVCPPGEMQALLPRILELLAWVEAKQTALSTTSQKLVALEQAALAKAFRGELLPQDPSDEPASALLERIRGARSDETQRARRGRPSRPAEPELFATTPDPSESTSKGGSPDAVIEAFRSSARQTATGLGTATGLHAATVKKALKALVDAGKVRVEGKARGTSYVWVG